MMGTGSVEKLVLPGSDLHQGKAQMQSKDRGSLPEVKEESDAFYDSISFPKVYETSQDLAYDNLDGTSLESTDEEDDDEDDGAEFCENASNQIVLYDPDTGERRQASSVPEPDCEPHHLPRFAASNNSIKVLPSVGAFSVQCATCFKWRLIPTKEKYEKIRAHIMEVPFVCETVREWRPDISCEDPADISQDSSRLWAIDKPSISRPPPGWQRLLRIRGEGGTRFADVYYVAPCGKRMRSMVEVEKFLVENPGFLSAGINMSHFSFQIPKPLQENYVRKRPSAKAMLQCNGARLETMRPLEPGEGFDRNILAVNPLSWAGPVQFSDFVTRPDKQPAPFMDAPDPVVPPTKKLATRRPSMEMYGTGMCSQPKDKAEEP